MSMIQKNKWLLEIEDEALCRKESNRMKQKQLFEANDKAFCCSEGSALQCNYYFL